MRELFVGPALLMVKVYVISELFLMEPGVIVWLTVTSALGEARLKLTLEMSKKRLVAHAT